MSFTNNLDKQIAERKRDLESYIIDCLNERRTFYPDEVSKYLFEPIKLGKVSKVEEKQFFREDFVRFEINYTGDDFLFYCTPTDHDLVIKLSKIDVSLRTHKKAIEVRLEKNQLSSMQLFTSFKKIKAMLETHINRMNYLVSGYNEKSELIIKDLESILNNQKSTVSDQVEVLNMLIQGENKEFEEEES